MKPPLQRQLFRPGADAVFRLALLVCVVGLAVVLYAASAFSSSNYVTGVGIAREQPVPFSHKHHAGELGIDCRYCHAQAEYLETAGIPPTWTCMTCHSQIWTGSEMLAPVRDSLARNMPLVWARLNQLPSYVYFNHSVHIQKGIGCTSCHGAVTSMQLTYRANAFEMEFCINCHRNPEKFVRKPGEVWNMEWSPLADQDKVGPQLVADYHIAGPGRLTDCAICHR